MKIQELRLLACGPFTGHCLDLSGGSRGLHLIYGPNEAGKSSALRALKYLLFGFPPQLNDDFVHPYQSLRIGARICNDCGEELTIVRRKANKASLRAGDDIAMVNEDDLRRFCGSVAQDRFSTFFGIDHAMLVQGGKEIAEGAGDIGQILFTGGGVTDLNGVLAALEQEAEQLFMPSPRANRRLNQLLSELADARKAVRDSQLPLKEWEEHHQALDKALNCKHVAEAGLQEKSRAKNRLERIRKALPLIATLTDARNAFADVATAVLLPVDFQGKRHTVEQNLRVAESGHSRSLTKIEELQRQIDGLDVPQALLDQRAAIEPISRRLGVYQQGQDDRPGLKAEAGQLEESAIETLRTLDKTLDLAGAETLQLTESKRLRIRELAAQYPGIVQDVETATSKMAELDRELSDIKDDLAQLPALQDTRPLAAALQGALRLGDAEEQLFLAEQECEALTKQTSIDLKRLPLWTGSLEELEALTLPLAETVDRFEAELANLEQELKTLERQVEDCGEKTREVNRKIEAIRLDRDLPTENDLQAAREQRREGWHLVRTAWLEDPAAPDLVQRFVDAIGETDDLASAFERSIDVSDEISDRLRREAERVATHAQLLAQQRACAERAAALNAKRESDCARRNTTLLDWKRLWEPLRVERLLPREMRAWSQQHSALARDVQHLRLQREQVRQLQGRVGEQRSRLTTAMQLFGFATASTRTTLAESIAAAQQTFDEANGLAQRHNTLAADLQRLEKEGRRAQDKLTKAQLALATWQNQWGEAITDLPLDARGSPGEANAVLDLMSALNQQSREVRGMKQRINLIDGNAVEFTEYVQRLAAQLGIAFSNLPVAQVASELGARLSNALANDQNRILIREQLTIEEKHLETASETIAKARAQLAALCAQAECPSAGELPGAEERSDRRRSLNAQVEELERQLRDLSAGQTLAAFIAQTESLDADVLEPQVQQLEEQIAGLDRELKDELGPKIGAERHALDQMDSSAKAADAADHVQDLIARIAAGADEYARLLLALVTLRKGIARYRERHQGPIVQRASRLFSELTIASFSALRDDYDDEGRPELVGVRTTADKPIRVGEMSDGTADQLYLAVRLAWLEEYLDSHEAMPFIVDDVLIRFDNERAVATLKTLADLSRRTQVIYFTHHRHIVDLARRSLDATDLFTHELPSHLTAQTPGE